MRISVTKGDPGYIGSISETLNDPIRKARITLDGAPIRHVITADEEEGFVEVLMHDENGRYLADGNGGTATEIKRGTVRIIKADG